MTMKTGAKGFRFNRYLVLFLTLIILLAGVLPFVTVADNENSSLDVLSQSSRGSPRASFIVTQDITWSVNKNYDNIWVQNGTLTIGSESTVTVKTFNVSENGSVVLKGWLKSWSVKAYCKSFTLPGGYLECKNGKQFTGEAPHSNVKIHTENSIELSKQALIRCMGPSGAPRSDGKGHRAGDSTIELISDSYISVTEESVISSIGGTGVKGSGRYDGGDGGWAYLTLQANSSNSDVSLLIQEATVSATGGKGGNHDESQSEPGNGGTSTLKLTSASNNNKDKIVIEQSTIISKGGNGGKGYTIPGNPGGSDINVKCKNQFYIDEYKASDKDKWLDPASTEITLGHPDGTPAITIEALKGAFIYTPKPEGLAMYIEAVNDLTVVNIYYMLDVQVADYSETPIPNSDVQIKVGSFTTGSGKTDSNGKISFLIEAYQITTGAQGENGILNYDAIASISGTSAEGDYPDDIFLDERYNFIEIRISLVLIDITKVMFAGDTYLSPEDGLAVAGEVTIAGTASSGFGV